MFQENGQFGYAEKEIKIFCKHIFLFVLIIVNILFRHIVFTIYVLLTYSLSLLIAFTEDSFLPFWFISVCPLVIYCSTLPLLPIPHPFHYLSCSLQKAWFCCLTHWLFCCPSGMYRKLIIADFSGLIMEWNLHFSFVVLRKRNS